MNIIYYVASSLDGYIADKQDGVGWLDNLSIEHEPGEYEAFFNGIDALLMGRATYDFVHNYGKWPYGDLPTWVCTTQPMEPLSGCNLKSAADMSGALNEAIESGVSNMWMVGGGELAKNLLQKEVLTHLSVSIMPVVLGSGKKLVGDLVEEAYLRQTRAQPRNGYTQIEYAVDYRG